MVPDTLGAILVFLAFIVPGLAFELLRERRRPFIEETAFREASRIALTSMLFSTGSIAALWVLNFVEPGHLANPAGWISGGTTYLSTYLEEATFTLLAFMALSLIIALAADWGLRRSAPGRIVPGSIWFSLFRQHRPENTTPWVHLRLTDETEIWGFVGDYTPDQKLENRELIIEQPGLQYRRKGSDENTRLATWAFVAVRGDCISWMKVQYVRNGHNEGDQPEVVAPIYR